MEVKENNLWSMNSQFKSFRSKVFVIVDLVKHYKCDHNFWKQTAEELLFYQFKAIASSGRQMISISYKHKWFAGVMSNCANDW